MITYGTLPATITPASDIYTIIAAKLTAKNWVEQVDSPVPLATAGTTADVRVWANSATTPSLYLLIEVDDTNTRLRFRVCEQYNKVQTITLGSADPGDTFKLTYQGVSTPDITIGTNATAANIQTQLRTLTTDNSLTVTGSTDTGPFTVTFSSAHRNTAITAGTVVGMTITMSYSSKMLYACGGQDSLDSVSQTVASSGANSNAEQTIFQTQSSTSTVGWVSVGVQPAGFPYIVGANSTHFVFSAFESGTNRFIIAGIVEPISGSIEPSNRAVFMLSSVAQASWTTRLTTAEARISREPGSSGTSAAGYFCYVVCTPSTCYSDFGGSPQVPHKWRNITLYPATLHGMKWNNTSGYGVSNSAARSFRGFITGFVMDTGDNILAVLDTITSGGTTYYYVGQAGAIAYQSNYQEQNIWVDGSLF